MHDDDSLESFDGVVNDNNNDNSGKKIGKSSYDDLKGFFLDVNYAKYDSILSGKCWCFICTDCVSFHSRHHVC